MLQQKMASQEKIRVLMVCMGNICRSPTAEGVLRAMVEQSPLAGKVEIDSAGTTDYHTGSRPDPRAIRIAAARGYDLGKIRARQVKAQDFERFDYILAMDNTNVRHLRETWPESASARVERLLDYGRTPANQEVPDPYYGSERDFEHALDLIENGCRGLLESLTTHFPASQTAGRE